MKKRLHIRGFTVAEILITLVIIGFVAALGVPMIGQKKMKKPLEVLSRHGTMECFYFMNQVWQFTSDNIDNPDGSITILTGSDYCTFTAPKANGFVFQVVGAGGAGASGTPSYIFEGEFSDGYVRTDTNFASDLASAPEWVREYWDDQWDGNVTYTPQYYLTSPLSGSGDAYCEKRRNDEAGEQCIAYCSLGLDSCPASCLFYVEAKGGEGGQGVKALAYAQLHANNDISYTTTTTETTLSNGYTSVSMVLDDASQYNGGDAYACGDDACDGANGASFMAGPGSMVQDAYSYNRNTNGYIMFTGSREAVTPSGSAGTGCSSPTGRAAAPGEISVVAPGYIEYYQYSPSIRASFGTAGESGTNTVKVFENIPYGTTFRLKPALNNSSDSVVQVQSSDNSNYWATFLTGASGEDGTSYDEMLISLEDRESIWPFPSPYYDQTQSKAPSPSIIISENGFTSFMYRNSALFKAGWGGEGYYPYVKGFSSASTWGVSKYINGVMVDPGSTAADYLISLPSDYNDYPDSYVGDPTAHAGAIIVTW